MRATLSINRVLVLFCYIAMTSGCEFSKLNTSIDHGVLGKPGHPNVDPQRILIIPPHDTNANSVGFPEADYRCGDVLRQLACSSGCRKT